MDNKDEFANIKHIILGINNILTDEDRLVENKDRLIHLNKQAVHRLETLLDIIQHHENAGK